MSYRSRAYGSITATVVGRQIERRQTTGKLSYALLGSEGRVAPLTIDLLRLSYHYTDANGVVIEEDSPVDTDAVLNWMKVLGVDAADENVQLEARELATIAKLVAAGTRVNDIPARHLTTRGVGVTSLESRGPPKWSFGLAVVFWIALWILGLRRINKTTASASPVR